MFDTYKAVKYLEKEGNFSQKQAESIIRLMSGSAEHNHANLTTMQDIELLRKYLANIENNINKTRAELSELSIEIQRTRTEIIRNRTSWLKWAVCVSFGIMVAILGITLLCMSKYVEIIYYLAQHTPK